MPKTARRWSFLLLAFLAVECDNKCGQGCSGGGCSGFSGGGGGQPNSTSLVATYCWQHVGTATEAIVVSFSGKMGTKTFNTTETVTINGEDPHACATTKVAKLDKGRWAVSAQGGAGGPITCPVDL